VEKIPNLLEWRQISCAELAELLQKERTLATRLNERRVAAGSNMTTGQDDSEISTIE
jgi:hypothetical protein